MIESTAPTELTMSMLPSRRPALRFPGAVLILLGVIVCIQTPATAVMSTFDDGTLQGWTKLEPFLGDLDVATVDGELAMQFKDTGAGGPAFALAPAGHGGDLSGLPGISWDEYVYDAGVRTVIATSIVIEGPDGTRYQTDNTLGPVAEWNARSASFDAADWNLRSGAATFGEVITDVQALYVSLETSNTSGALESAVDNIWIIPEPATASLLALGMACLAGRRSATRRRL